MIVWSKLIICPTCLLMEQKKVENLIQVEAQIYPKALKMSNANNQAQIIQIKCQLPTRNLHKQLTSQYKLHRQVPQLKRFLKGVRTPRLSSCSFSRSVFVVVVQATLKTAVQQSSIYCLSVVPLLIYFQCNKSGELF